MLLWKPGEENDSDIWIPGKWQRQWNATVEPEISAEDLNEYYSPFYKQTWRRARSECRKTGGYLASIHNPTEHLLVKDKIGEQGFVWVGGKQAMFRNKKVWTWSDATLFGNFSLVNIESKGGCMTLSKQGIYNSTRCSEQLHFVCKKGIFFLYFTTIEL